MKDPDRRSRSSQTQGGISRSSPTSVPLADVREIVGERAFRCLRRGGYLQVWRNSSPHNWWVETTRREMLWHSSDDRAERVLPSLSGFESVRQEGRVIQYWGGDSGAVRHEFYRLKRSAP